MPLPKLTMLFFAFFSSLLLSAQDTMPQRLLSAKVDTNKLAALNKYAYSFAEITPEKAFPVLENAIKTSERIGYPIGVGRHLLRSRVEAMNGQIQVDAGAGRGVSAYPEFDTASLGKQVTVINEKEMSVTI